MSISISNALFSEPFTLGTTLSAPAAAAKPAPQPTNDSPYTVQLTSAQQVYNLYNQGRTVPQIASSLNLSVELVNNFLNISSSQG